MREIKFRAWDTDKQEMAHVSHMNFDDYEVGLQNEGGSWYSAGHYTACIMQYTGLKDKNDKEIYEGDIIRLSFIADTVGVVMWETDGWKIIDEVGSIYRWDNRTEVIGNIYENPGLLGQI